MKSILLCEGSTDFVLLQYFMRCVFKWKDKERGPGFLRPTRTLMKENRELVIGGVGGCGQIIAKMRKVIETNCLSSTENEFYKKIVIVTDRDDVNTEIDFIGQIQRALSEYQVIMQKSIQMNEWLSGEMVNARNEKVPFELLVLIIPFEDTGALETFLLDSISKQSDYDRIIIEQSNRFVDKIDPEKRYLTSRRYLTKAKFDVYFSIRTPSAFFVERQNILKGINWEEYIEIQRCFQNLEGL